MGVEREKLKSDICCATDERRIRKIKIENPAPINILLITNNLLVDNSFIRDDFDKVRVNRIALVSAPKMPNSSTPIRYPVILREVGISPEQESL